MTAPPRIEARGLGKRFGRRRALQGVDVAVAEGEALAVLGPNGAGKSTLLRVFAGLLRPDEGRVLVAGKALGSDPADARRRAGYLGHDLMLYECLTPRENLLFFGRLHGVPSLRTRVDQLLRALALEDRADGPVRELSRGLKQRVALARTLVHDPDLLLLDEPHAGLDAHASAVLADLLASVCRRGRTLVLVTHDLARAKELCRRAIVLERGRVASERSGSDVGAPVAASLDVAAPPPRHVGRA